MSKKRLKQLRATAAHARSFRHPRSPSPSIASSTNVETISSRSPSPYVVDDRDFDEPIYVDSGDESDCGYNGGVCELLPEQMESEVESNDDLWTDNTEGSESSDSDLAEFDKETLEFWQEEASELAARKSAVEMLQEGPKDWRKIESNRELGYNGQSERTRSRRQKEARDRDAKRTAAKTS
ncbi:hypothetical protein H0H87_008100 [Tephrocybe sp. NHM501043]|nr:hypothetical protein H0H87_010585 [Tephrocybe sp. NHM501043]KAG6843074.1 hypothetical protein H0H87_008099 [Tephrocybe sp. NHM501043]KAG6854004.1 hypothetical protein H0H87_008100 [Tephrocybe sp. NHM501043]